MKIRRHRIEAAVATQVEAWYNNSGTVHWA